MGARGGGHSIGRALAALVSMLAASAVAAGSTGDRSAEAAFEAESANTPIRFVPLGGFPRRDASALARYVRARLGLQTQVLGPGTLPRSAYDAKRKQYVSEQLIEALFPRKRFGSKAVVIGLLEKDMYAKLEPFRFVFSLRHPGGFAVVSRIRMDPKELGLTPDPALRMRRLQKMVLKQVGVLSLGHRGNANPRSVLFDAVLGVDDLDYMTQEFRPAPASGARKAWLSGSTRVCKASVSSAKAFEARTSPQTPDEVVAYIREGADLRARHRSELARIRPAGGDRARLGVLLTRFGRSIAADRTAAATLDREWSDGVGKSWAQHRLRFALALKADALELGSLACARYFDPLTYG
jgi:predicted Zn-dependent protease